ncbi:hypothetical protein MSAN_00603600 [Mycena sanguinolenta]|uniref:Uncharacterized protein n=1 Tax=Mycena sanguinolenta TaxID=230812 RepID=A0A8H6ZAN8_9AGAR|nr:hypothetical protein MSAN_00603600 [Mycena sanguinolenta]
MSSTKTSCFISIHRAPSHLSRTEFEAKAGALGDAIAALPIAQKNLLKLDIISQNTLMDKHMKGVGLPVPSPTVVMLAEYESLDHLAQMLKDPALQKLLTESDDFGFRTGATAFAADVITKVEVPGATAGTNVICIYHQPPNMSAGEFAQNMGNLMDKISAQSIGECFTHYSLCVQNEAVDKHLQALGYPAPEPLLVVRADSENLDRMIEIFEHSEVAQLLTDGIRDLGFHRDNDNRTHSCCFSADVATKINNY